MEPERLKTRHNDSTSRSGTPQPINGTTTVDQLANEIFALLNEANRQQSIDAVQARLATAARMLVRPTAESEAAAHLALQELPANQLEVLLSHLGGMTCPQIAARLERSEHAVFEDLTRAYVRLRHSFGADSRS